MPRKNTARREEPTPDSLLSETGDAEHTNGEALDVDNAESNEVLPGSVDLTPPPGSQVVHSHSIRYTAPAANVRNMNNARTHTPAYGGADVIDPLRDFLEQFTDGDVYTMQVTRDPDPMLKRPPNPTYRRPCYVREILGYIPLSPQTFIDDIRALNGMSGGNFTVSVYDGQDEFADTWRGNIGDPVITADNTAPTQTTPAPQNDMERFITMMRQQAELAKLARQIAGVSENAQPTAQADPKLQLASLLIDHADVVGKMMTTLSTTVEKVTSGAAAEKPSGFLDMAKQAIFTNPRLQDRVLKTTDRIIDVAGRALGADPLPPNAAPEQFTGDDVTSDGDDDNEMAENAEAVLMDFLANECAEGRNVTVHHPIFLAFANDAPDEHGMFMLGLDMYEPDALIDLILQRAAAFDRAGYYRLVFKRPEGVAWVKHLKDSATTQPTPTTTETNTDGN